MYSNWGFKHIIYSSGLRNVKNSYLLEECNFLCFTFGGSLHGEENEADMFRYGNIYTSYTK